MITVTESAQKKIEELLESKGLTDHALRIAIQGRGPGGFLYHMQFVDQDTAAIDDQVSDFDSFKLIVDTETEPNLAGSTLDFIDDIHQRGFKIDNPNPLWRDPIATNVQQILDTHINPAVAGHGGFVSLIDIKDDTAYIAFGGGCQGCGLVDVTLKQGVEVMIREAIPEIQRVVDTTDHDAGRNPYYQPAKGGGQSPLAR